MNTCIGRTEFSNFQIRLDSGSSSMIMMGKSTSELEQKETTVTTWENQATNAMTLKNERLP